MVRGDHPGNDPRVGIETRVAEISYFSSFEGELRNHFREAWISGYESLISKMTNDEKDRHVVAAAVRAQASIIVTFNLRYFRPEHLDPWNVRAIHPESFLIGVFRQEQALVVEKLERQAGDRSRSLQQLLEILKATIPAFATLVSNRTEKT